MATGFPTFNSNTPEQPVPNAGSQQPPQSPQQGQGMQAPAPRIMVLLSNWGKVAGEIGEHYAMISSQMNKIQSFCREALMVLAKEASQGQQGQGGLPTQDTSAAPQTAQPQANPAGYPPSGY